MIMNSKEVNDNLSRVLSMTISNLKSFYYYTYLILKFFHIYVVSAIVCLSLWFSVILNFLYVFLICANEIEDVSMHLNK